MMMMTAIRLVVVSRVRMRMLSMSLFLCILLSQLYILLTFVNDHYYSDEMKSLSSSEELQALNDEFVLTRHCARLNSIEWLQATRRSNNDESFVNNAHLHQAVLMVDDEHNVLAPKPSSSAASARSLLELSLAYNTSNFVNDQDTSNVRAWTVRLMYLAIHYHQTKHAVKEARMRMMQHQNNPQQCNELLRQHWNVKSHDFECPNAKHLIVALSDFGLGANVRGLITVTMLVGLMTDRVVHFVNAEEPQYAPPQQPKGTRSRKASFQRGWPWVSCANDDTVRQDYQCFFLPETPCVLTHHDLSNARNLPHATFRQILTSNTNNTNGTLPDDDDDDAYVLLQDAKVWYTTVQVYPHYSVPEKVSRVLHGYAKQFVDALPSSDPRLPVLRQAVDAILEPDVRNPPRDDDNNNKNIHVVVPLRAQHAIMYWALRPHTQYAAKIDSMLQSLPPSDPEQTVGLMVRGTDKCERESECFSFQKHLKAMTQILQQQTQLFPTSSMRNDVPVLFTTESQQAVKQQQRFVLQQQQKNSLGRQHLFPYNYSILVNTADVIPDTGLAHGMKRYTANENMLSALTTLKFQMRARLSVGNCCSNFHQLVAAFLYEGLGAASRNDFVCLQEMKDPQLRICCDRQCRQQRAMDLASTTTKRQTNITTSSCIDMRLHQSQVAQQQRLKPIWVAGYPGSGNDLIRTIVRAVTGFEGEDVYKGNHCQPRQNRTIAATCKTHWPVYKSRFSPVSRPNDFHKTAILLIRNPTKALPSHFNYIWEDKNRIADHSEQAPENDWLMWRDANFEQQLQGWKQVLTWWLENYNTTTVLPYEKLVSEESAPGLLKILADQLKTAGFPVSPDLDCQWRDAVQRKAIVKRKGHKYIPTFTLKQYDAMLREIRQLLKEYQYHRPRLYSTLQTYAREIEEFTTSLRNSTTHGHS